MTKAWLVSRTQTLMAAAGIAVVDPSGKPTKINASSWRAGGVRSALDANWPDSVIMEFGRWRSAAWHHYLMFSPMDLQGACRRMWEASVPVGAVTAVCTQDGDSFVCVPSTRTAQATARAKSQLRSAIAASSPSAQAHDQATQTATTFALLDASLDLLQNC